MKSVNLKIIKNQKFGVDMVLENPSIGKGKTVLVVDDDVDILPLIGTFLEAASFKYITAESAEKAIVLLDDGAVPDLLLTDINMPGMDGFKLAENLKEAKPDIGVVYMSAYSSSTYKSYDVEAKDQFLKKPFELPALIHALMNARTLTV